jgi:N-acetylmuramoyl-L-alanine amidase
MKRMKRRSKLIVGIVLISIIIAIGGFHRKQVAEQGSTVETTEETTQESQINETQTRTTEEVKMVQIYVDEDSYDPAVESENDYVAIYQTDQQETVVGKIHRGSWADYISETDDMVEILTDDGIQGYISKKHATIQEATFNDVPTTLSDFQIVLDAGHGGEDSGALSTDQTIMEKDLTLKMVLAIGEALTEAGVQVSYTRTEDTYLSLAEITNISLDQTPDLFLSIHFDNSEIPNTNQGLTAYYYYDKSEDMATNLATNLSASVNLSSNSSRFGNYYVLREQYTPAVLLELGYLNSDSDLATITSANFSQNVAQSIVQTLQEQVDENK